MHSVRVLICALVVAAMSGCSLVNTVVISDTDGFEVHTLKEVTVIYGSREAIMKKYKELGGTDENLWGFSIPPLNIMYCTKGAHVVCGHELQHLTDGYYHD